MSIPTDSSTTQRLLQQANTSIPTVQRKSDSVLAELFARHRPELERMIGLRLDPRLRSRIDPHDILQETYLEAQCRFADYCARRPMPFALWLSKTARQLIARSYRDHAQTAKRNVLREETWPDHSSQLITRQFLERATTPSDHVAQQEFCELVIRAVSQLDESDRDLLIMRHIEDLSHAAIGHLLEIQEATARQRYARAILKLRTELQRVGVNKESLDGR